MTATCLQNMLVLSAGTAIQADSRGQAIQAATVTLLATPEQAETLTLANTEGRIQLVLRNGSDQTIEKTPGREISRTVWRPCEPQEAQRGSRAAENAGGQCGCRGAAATTATAAGSDRRDSRNPEERGEVGAGRTDGGK